MRSFCVALQSFSHFFSIKGISVFGNKEMKHLTNRPFKELIKLTVLLTTGPCSLINDKPVLVLGVTNGNLRVSQQYFSHIRIIRG